MYASMYDFNDDAAMIRLKDEWVEEGGSQFSSGILVLASLNVLAAALTIGSILWEAHSKGEWDFYPQTRSHLNFIPTVHPAEVFPVVFAMAVIFQGIVFISIGSAQSQDSTLSVCRAIAQLVWPAIWIVPYTMLVFGLETTFRSLQRTKFSSQGRWSILVCVIAILILTVLTWILSSTSPTRGQCLASLIWFTAHYAQAGVTLCLALIVGYVTSASVITFQLMRTAKVDRDQRIQASRVVYYLIASTLVLGLIAPYYVEAIMLSPTISLSKIAKVAANTTGLISGLFYILFRSNADWTMIQAFQAPRWLRKQKARRYGSDGMNIYEHMNSPVSPQSDTSPSLWNDPEKIPYEFSTSRPISGPLPQLAACPTLNSPQTPEIVMPPKLLLTRHHTQHRANYSVFPPHAPTMARESVSTTFSQGSEDIEVPKPLLRGHQRQFSGQSSATCGTSTTVQIGFRLSFLRHSLDPIEQPPVTSLPSPSRDTSYCTSPFIVDTALPRPVTSETLDNDISILPTEPNDARTPSQALGSRSDLLSPNWLLRKGNGMSIPRRTGGIMKSLPPVPLGEIRDYSRLSKLPWKRDVAPAQRWI